MQGLLQEFALSSQEGVALMCLAEALLRIPDAATRDALIRDKIGSGDWHAHLGASPSLFVNAATWGLLLTGKLVATHSEAGLAAALRRLIARGGEPLIRKGVDMAMRLMGEQFVTGETIAQALANAREREAEGFRYSYDMLGEAALTARRCRALLAAYEQAIHAIGQASAGRGIDEGPGISIKLSALHPRYSRAQVERVMAELLPAAAAAGAAGAAARHRPQHRRRRGRPARALARPARAAVLRARRWPAGTASASSSRPTRSAARRVVDYLVDLARRSGHRLMVRLVKGAYWDSEIKRAQVDGLDGYPVYTRKAYTDVSYLACARKLLAAPDAVFPQFATHNAQTLAAIHALAGPDCHAGQYEFQCLHGMGEPLYEQVVGRRKLARPAASTRRSARTRRCWPTWCAGCWRTAPTPPSSTASPTSAVRSTSWSRPGATVRRWPSRGGVGLPHPAIALPRGLYRRGAAQLARPRPAPTSPTPGGARRRPWPTAQRGAGTARRCWADGLPPGPGHAVAQPGRRRDVVGQVHEADAAAIEAALQCAQASAAAWAASRRRSVPRRCKAPPTCWKTTPTG